MPKERMRAPLVLITIGRTAAGKTTLAKYIAKKSHAIYIPEAAIKRLLRPHYKSDDSLDEKLRDIAYRAAIAACRAVIDYGINAFVDASFHRRKRRTWLYKSIEGAVSGLLVFYCKCPNKKKIRDRILDRQRYPNTAETQANSMKIYKHINLCFQEPSMSEFPEGLPFLMFEIDTDSNEMKTSLKFPEAPMYFRRIVKRIETVALSRLQEYRKRGVECSL